MKKWLSSRRIVSWKDSLNLARVICQISALLIFASQPQALYAATDFTLSLDEFESGLAQVSVWGTGKHVFIDTAGNVVLSSDNIALGKGERLEGVTSFRSGLAIASISNSRSEKRSGFIDKTGKWVIPARFENARLFSKTDPSIAAVKLNGKWGLIDKVGRWVISPRFDEAISGFDKSYAQVRVGNDSWGIIDQKGNWAVRLQDDRNGSPPPIENIMGDAIWLYDPATKKVGLMELYTGRWRLPPQFDKYAHTDEEASVCIESGCYWIDRTGQANFVSTGLSYLSNLHGGIAAAQDKMSGKWGLVNAAGKWILQPIYKDIPLWSGEGLWRAELDYERKVYINRAGERAFKFELKRVSKFFDGVALVEDSTGTGYMAPDGSWAISPAMLKKTLEPWFRQIRESAARDKAERMAVFRKGLKQGDDTNCGPIIEIKPTMVKVYFPVATYGNEHWIKTAEIFSSEYACRFVNGRYFAPDDK